MINPTYRVSRLISPWSPLLGGLLSLAACHSDPEAVTAEGGDSGTTSSTAPTSTGGGSSGSLGSLGSSGSSGSPASSAPSGSGTSGSNADDAPDAAGITSGSGGANSDGSGGSPSDSGSSAENGGKTGDAGSATSAGSSTCAGLFCEDFESGRIDPAIWDTKTYGGQTVVVQSGNVAHGKYAVQFHAKPSDKSYDFIITKSAPAGLRGHHFGRAYFYLTPQPPTGHTEFLFAGSTGFPTYDYLEVASNATAWQLTFVHLVVPAGGISSTSATQETARIGGTIPLVKWTCLEWEFNDAPDAVTLYVDGNQDLAYPAIGLNGKSSGLVGGFADFGFGFYAWHPAKYAFDVYYDDIVLDTKRVGCL